MNFQWLRLIHWVTLLFILSMFKFQCSNFKFYTFTNSQMLVWNVDFAKCQIHKISVPRVEGKFKWWFQCSSNGFLKMFIEVQDFHQNLKHYSNNNNQLFKSVFRFQIGIFFISVFRFQIFRFFKSVYRFQIGIFF